MAGDEPTKQFDLDRQQRAWELMAVIATKPEVPSGSLLNAIDNTFTDEDKQEDWT
ncbi:hypothetical protein V5735_24120 (plasmid) [Haladaptatus sp. SPP-AMP-3]|uniref:hypothetical protein n=1 Tax=Haladaptatus sp. SPP-AMP-3 TaxID=3121295 RepID=UPI003C2FEE09